MFLSAEVDETVQPSGIQGLLEAARQPDETVEGEQETEDRYTEAEATVMPVKCRRTQAKAPARRPRARPAAKNGTATRAVPASVAGPYQEASVTPAGSAATVMSRLHQGRRRVPGAHEAAALGTAREDR